MKKQLIFLLCLFISFQEILACGWYDPNEAYFNLFTQHIIKDKSFIPFLLTYNPGFYEREDILLPDENIEDWQKYFNNELTYQQTKELVYKVSIEDLNDLKFKRTLKNNLLKNLKSNFYKKYKDGMDYLIEAKFLEPYMTVVSEYDYEEAKNAGKMDYDKITSDLISLYESVTDNRIKLRYGYQMIRFQHYNLKFNDAVQYFDEYVVPLNLKTAPYYLALDQYAGALRGLGENDKANYNFFQVFLHTKKRKASAFSSMRFTSKRAFNDLLSKAKNNKEKEMAYFLLGYQSFNNPLSIMEKIYAINPNSEVLKVLEARAINELERNFLQTNPNNVQPLASFQTPKNIEYENIEVKLSFWGKIGRFFRRLFGIEDEKKQKPKFEPENTASAEELSKSPNRLPVLEENNYYENDSEYTIKMREQLNAIAKITTKIGEKANDEFWKISLAYIKFLQQEYQKSETILNEITTENKGYLQQIQQMKMLNDIVSQPKIDAEFEEHLVDKYENIFVWKKHEDYGYIQMNEITQFIVDILANRYYLQGEKGKSYLMNNLLSNLKSNPDIDLTKSLHYFCQKENKSSFEKKIISKNIDIENPIGFFNLIYGDFAMRKGNFNQADKEYKKVSEKEVFTKTNDNTYDHFNNISKYIFGHNRMESFQSKPEETMELEPFMNEFEFINDYMTKKEMTAIILKLKKIGEGNNERASKANQLIGNVLLNTSKQGYFRHIFMLDLTNGRSDKFDLVKLTKPKYYYKISYWSPSSFENDDFDLPISYYQRAFDSSNNNEQKARLLFQMGTAERGKFDQWANENKRNSYSYDEWEEPNMQRIQNERFRTYFNKMKQQEYVQTQTMNDLLNRCTHFRYFMRY